jgi:hypothetical protein
MHSISVPLRDKLQQSTVVDSKLRLTAEWNHNRFSEILSVTNVIAEKDEYDNDLFPLKSITDPERPTRGIVKNWAGSNTPDGYVSNTYKDAVVGARYVTASPEAKYKYYTGPTESAVGGSIANVAPQVVYKNSVVANKIRVVFENSYASPSVYTIQTTVDGTTWVTAATSPAIGAGGVVELWRQANGTWGNTPYYDNPLTTLRGVKVNVTSMATAAVRCNIIELGLRLESDLSTYVMDWSCTQTMSEISFVAPIGQASSNTAEVSLSNTTGVFSNENASSIYYKLLDKNVEMRMDIGMNIGTFASPNYEYVRQFTMRTTEWTGQTRQGTSVTLSDASEYLQSVKPNPFLYEEVTVGEAIWRVLDSVGFSYWSYTILATDPSTMLPYFYSDGSETVWEVIAQLAEVTQTAVFFDEYGILKILPRAQAYNLSNPVAWQFEYAQNGAKVPDIMELATEYDFEANVVDITYTPTALSKESDSGVRPMEVVWEPEDTVTLRSSNLVKTMSNTDQVFNITAGDAKLWPYAGIVQVEGEFIRYTAKEYSYRLANNTVAKKMIKSEDERIALDKLNPTYAYQNTFTGNFEALTANRGIWNTTPVVHDLNYSQWTSKRYRKATNAVTKWAGGFLPQTNYSLLKLMTNSTFTTNTWYAVTCGLSTDPMPLFYGTRMRYTDAGFSSGGIVIAAGTNDSGIYIDVQQTEGITTTSRKYGHEVGVHTRYSNGTYKRYGKGAQVTISRNVWFDLDVRVIDTGAQRVIDVMINGVKVSQTTIPDAEWPDSTGGRHGLYVRGATSAFFEYFYSWRTPVNDTFDDATWWNRIKGGYQSNQYDSELSYGLSWITLRNGSKASRIDTNSYRRMDDFGPIIHEVREFKVDFATKPVVYSQLYFSNDSQVICPEYNATPFGASFILANASRDNAVLSGEDTLTFGADNPVDQVFVVYGRSFVAEDERKYTVKDTQSITRRGEVNTEIASKWIQSEDSAKSLGQWITYHWSGGNDQVNLKSFGNPLLQLGDLVSINDPSSSMAPSTHQYFIVGISQSYGEGLETTFTLRRRKI